MWRAEQGLPLDSPIGRLYLTGLIRAAIDGVAVATLPVAVEWGAGGDRLPIFACTTPGEDPAGMLWIAVAPGDADVQRCATRVVAAFDARVHRPDAPPIWFVADPRLGVHLPVAATRARFELDLSRRRGRLDMRSPGGPDHGTSGYRAVLDVPR